MDTAQKNRKKPAYQPADEASAQENLTTRVTEAIRQAIVDATFQLGEALSETSLAARFGVSRTPVREALSTLQRQGMIVIRPQSGSFVFMPTEEDVAELCEFRRMIETAALRFAWTRRREQALAEMQQAIAEMRVAHEADNQAEYSRADSAFHESIVANSANRYLIESYTMVSGRMWALRTYVQKLSPPLRRRSTAAHLRIVSAFERGDLHEAERIIDEHVTQIPISFRAAQRAESSK